MKVQNGWKVIRTREARRQYAETHRKPAPTQEAETGTTRSAEAVDAHVASFIDLVLGKDSGVFYDTELPSQMGHGIMPGNVRCT